MKKSKITAAIVKESSGYSITASVGKHFIASEGETFDELKSGFMEAVNLALKNTGFTYTFQDVTMNYDLESFFNFYKVLNAKALSERIGMNQSLLAQYIKGIKKPSAVQVKRIMEGVHQIGRELSEARFLI